MSLLNGRIEDKNYFGRFIDGKKYGEYKSWHENGQLEKKVIM